MDVSRVLNELLDRTQLAMLLADDNRIYLGANQAACSFLDRDVGDIVGLRIDDLASPELKPRVPDVFADFLRTGSQSGPYTLVRRDGRVVKCSYSASANILPGVHISVFVPEELFDSELDTAEAGMPQRNVVPLTDREKVVLTLLALGESNATIAKQLHLSPETVRSHTRSARLKLGAKSRSNAIALAITSGQLELDAS